MKNGKADWKSDEKESGKQKWIKDTLEIRKNAQEILWRIDAQNIHYYRTVKVHDLVKKLHGQVLSYADNLRTKSDKITGELWDTNLMKKMDGYEEVTVPKPSEDGYYVGKTDIHGEVPDIEMNLLGNCEAQVYPVNPETLNRYWRAGNEITLSANIQTSQGVRQKKVSFCCYLPPAASSALIEQLDMCLGDLDWLPGGVKTVVGTVKPSGDIEIVDT